MKRAMFCLLAAVGSMAPAGPLHDAAEKGDASTVSLLAATADVNERDKQGRTPLTIAADGKHADVVASLLAAGADHSRMSQVTKDDFLWAWTPLTHAAIAGSVDVMELLVKAGASPLGVEGQTLPPMQGAARGGSIEAMAYLHKVGAPLDQPDDRDRTPLVLTAMMGHVDAAKWLLEKGARLDYESDGATLMIWAANDGHTEMVRFLAGKGLDVNDDVDHINTIGAAAKRGKWETVRALVELGADVNASMEYSQGESLPLLAARDGQVEMMHWLMERGARLQMNNLELGYLGKAGHTESIEAILALGHTFEPDDSQDAMESTCEAGHAKAAVAVFRHYRAMLGARVPEDDVAEQVFDALAAEDAKALESALRSGLIREKWLVECAEELTLASGDPALLSAFRRNIGRSSAAAARQEELDEALSKAATAGDLQRVKELVEQGANADAFPTNPFDAPLYEAISNKHTAVVRYLFEAGARNVPTRGTMAALPVAVGRGTPEMVKLFLGDEPLTPTYAVIDGVCDGALTGNLPTVELALDLGISPNAQVYGSTPLMKAASNNKVEMIEMLLRRGADPNIEIRGETAMSHANRGGHVAAAQALARGGAKGNPNRALASVTAALGKGPEALSKALAAGGNPNEWESWTALYLSTWTSGISPEDRLRMFRMLLDAGAYMDDSVVYESCHQAAKLPYLIELLKRGLLEKRKDEPLLIAAIHGKNAPGVRELLKSGVRLDVKGHDGRTLEMTLQTHGTPEIRAMVKEALRQREVQQ